MGGASVPQEAPSKAFTCSFEEEGTCSDGTPASTGQQGPDVKAAAAPARPHVAMKPLSPSAQGFRQHAGPTPDGQARRSPAPRNLHSAEGGRACRVAWREGELASPRTELGLEPQGPAGTVPTMRVT